MTYRVAIYVFPEVEALDFAGPYEVFSTASRVHARERPGEPTAFEVCTVARERAPVRARAGLTVLPDHDLASCPAPDLLLVPGGVVDAEVADVRVVEWVRAQARTVPIVASVCTGAFVLARAGLLRGRTATTHWEDAEALRAACPDLRVREDLRWVDEGAVVTSAGIAAGIDMSLHLVARLAGDRLAERTARQMDVPYRREP